MVLGPDELIGDAENDVPRIRYPVGQRCRHLSRVRRDACIFVVTVFHSGFELEIPLALGSCIIGNKRVGGERVCCQERYTENPDSKMAEISIISAPR